MSPMLEHDIGLSGLSSHRLNPQNRDVTRAFVANTVTEVDHPPTIVQEVLLSPGQPLNGQTRDLIEQRFNEDSAAHACTRTVWRGVGAGCDSDCVPRGRPGVSACATRAAFVLPTNSASHEQATQECRCIELDTYSAFGEWLMTWVATQSRLAQAMVSANEASHNTGAFAARKETAAARAAQVFSGKLE